MWTPKQQNTLFIKLSCSSPLHVAISNSIPMNGSETGETIGRQMRDRFEGAGLSKEVRRASQGFELFLAVKFRKPDHHVVVSTWDEQCLEI
jgi:hypothetical protein